MIAEMFLRRGRRAPHCLANHKSSETFAISLLILAGCLLVPLVNAQTYTIADLGSNAWSYSEAHGINGLGCVAGEYEPTNIFYVRAFMNCNGNMTDLGNLPGAPYAVAYAINDSNSVVGESDAGFATHAFLYSGGSMTDLGTLGFNNVGGYSSAHAINAYRQ